MTGLLSVVTGLLWIDIIIGVFIEEIAKIIPIIAVIKQLKIKSVSGAILIGFVIGAGFEISENLGYSTYFGFESLFDYGFIDESVLFIRLLYSFASHAIWGAIEGAAFALTSHEKQSKRKTLKVAIWYGFPVLTHLLSNISASFIVSTVLSTIVALVI